MLMPLHMRQGLVLIDHRKEHLFGDMIDTVDYALFLLSLPRVRLILLQSMVPDERGYSRWW